MRICLGIIILAIALVLPSQAWIYRPDPVEEEMRIKLRKIMFSRYIILFPPNTFFTDDDLLRRFEGATFPLYAGYTTVDAQGCVVVVRKTSYPVDSINYLFWRLKKGGYAMTHTGNGYYNEPTTAGYDATVENTYRYTQTIPDGHTLEIDLLGEKWRMPAIMPENSYVQFTKSCTITSNLAETRACLHGLKLLRPYLTMYRAHKAAQYRFYPLARPR